MNDLLNFVTTLFISIVIKFSEFYKWIEFKVLNLFSGLVEHTITGKLEQIGVILESPENNERKNNNDTHMLKKCNYDKVVRLQLINKRLLIQVANRGYIAMGEGYVNGDFKFTHSEDDITEFIERSMKNNFYKYYFNFWNRLLHYLQFECANLQTKTRAWEVGKKHYDLGNSFFGAFLDTNMQYSCGYWANAANLEEAQVDKMKLIARKLYLKPGMRVLDLGCGWGTLCKYFAQNYGVECVGVTVSAEGYQYAKRVCSGLPVKILLKDYREINEQFDRIYSIEMFEHVGFKNHRDFFKVAHRCLKDDGIFLLHTTTISDSTVKRVDPWIHAYVYPNMCHPFVNEICNGFDGLFIMEDWHNMSMDMSKTMIAWRENFQKNYHLISNQYDENFYRMWTYFTSMASAAYNSRKYQLAHVVLTKAMFQKRYTAVR